MSEWRKKMVDLGLTDEEQLEMTEPSPSPEAPQYPYGLRICLDDKTLAKLGLDDDPDGGDYIRLAIDARVTSVSRDQRDGGDVCRRVELQIERGRVIDDDDDHDGDDDGDDE